MLDQWNSDRDIGGYNDFGPRDPVPRDVLGRGPLRNERNAVRSARRSDVKFRRTWTPGDEGT